jgi:hypothetical protein
MRFLKLASNWFDPHPPVRPAGKEYIWPYAVDLSASGRMISFSEGAGHGAVGSTWPIEEAIKPVWTSQFEAAQGEWLAPYVLRLVEGETVTDDELIAAFVELHGREPESYEWNRVSR